MQKIRNTAQEDYFQRTRELLAERERAQAETRYAREIMDQIPGVTWGEAIRIAHARITKEPK